MSYVYILESMRNGKKYVGSGKIDPNKRLLQHNQGSNKWTRENGPFRLIYSEKCDSYKEARKKEIFFKTTTGRRIIKKLLSGSDYIPQEGAHIAASSQNF